MYNNINRYEQLPQEIYLCESTIYEQWTMVTDYAVKNIKPLYFISTFGRVYSYNTNSIIKGGTRNGYKNINLKRKDNSNVNISIHRLMMLSFHPIENSECYVVNHKDGIKSNNYIWNLEWVTPGQNIKHAYDSGLFRGPIGHHNGMSTIDEQQAEEICKLLISGKYNCKQIAEIIGCKLGVVYQISAGNSWKSVSDKYDLSNNKKLNIYNK